MLAKELDTIAKVYAARNGEALSNKELYGALEAAGIVDGASLASSDGKDRAGRTFSKGKRQVRWWQQDLRAAGVIEKVDGRRGMWRITGKGKSQFTQPAPGFVLLGFHTDLGVSLWGSFSDIGSALEGKVTLVLTSPPYPLSRERAYGNETIAEYVDWLMGHLEPLVRTLKDSASICLNLTNDVFLKGSPARSTYKERLLIAMEDRLGLQLMDCLIWYNKSRPPGPLQWASKTRQQLNQKYEVVIWMSPNPKACKANNRRVLQPHSKRHAELIARGGESRTTNYGDGAYRLRQGSFGNPTEGSIPGNVLEIGHRCKGQSQYKQYATSLGLPVHGAAMPEELPRRLVPFLTDEGDIVVDAFAGTGTVGVVCEELNRQYVLCETRGEYIRGSAGRFERAQGFTAGEALWGAMLERTERSAKGTAEQLFLDYA